MTPPPALVIELAIEADPIAYVTATNSAEADALRNWLVSNQENLGQQVEVILDQVEHIREATA
jgi:hypothetical protein